MSTARTPRGRTSSTIRFSPAPSEKATASATDACASPETCGGIGWRRAVSPTCARERRPSSGLIAATMCSSAVVSATLISRKVSSRSTPSGSTSAWCSRFASSVAVRALAGGALSERVAVVATSAHGDNPSGAGRRGEEAGREMDDAQFRFRPKISLPRLHGDAERNSGTGAPRGEELRSRPPNVTATRLRPGRCPCRRGRPGSSRPSRCDG